MGIVDPHAVGSAREQSASREASYVEKALGLVLLLVLVVGCFLVLRPFLTAILLAVILCVSTWRPFRRLRYFLGGRQTLAALLMTVMIAGLLLLPLAALAANLADDVSQLAATIRSAIDQGLPPPRWLGRLPLVGQEAQRIGSGSRSRARSLGRHLRPTCGRFETGPCKKGPSYFGHAPGRRRHRPDLLSLSRWRLRREAARVGDGPVGWVAGTARVADRGKDHRQRRQRCVGHCSHPGCPAGPQLRAGRGSAPSFSRRRYRHDPAAAGVGCTLAARGSVAYVPRSHRLGRVHHGVERSCLGALDNSCAHTYQPWCQDADGAHFSGFSATSGLWVLAFSLSPSCSLLPRPCSGSGPRPRERTRCGLNRRGRIDHHRFRSVST